MKCFAEVRADKIYCICCLENYYFKKTYQFSVVWSVFGTSTQHLTLFSIFILVFSALKFFFSEAFHTTQILLTSLQVDR